MGASTTDDTKLFDIWMLGCLAFQLLTGAPPFYPGRVVPYSIAYMAAALGDDTDTLYWSWYMRDKRMRNLPAVPAELVRDKAYVPTVEARLREALDRGEADGAISFIKACLRLNPHHRLSAKDAWSHPWLSRANACMCGYYCKREACGRH